MPTTLLLGERAPVRVRAGRTSLWRMGLAAAFVAVLLNAIIFALAVGAGVFPSLTLTGAGAQMSLEPVALVSFLGVVAGIGVFGLLRHLIQEPLRPFLWLAGVVLLLSFAAPFAIPGMATGQALVLNLLHLVVAGAVIASVLRVVRT